MSDYISAEAHELYEAFCSFVRADFDIGLAMFNAYLRATLPPGLSPDDIEQLVEATLARYERGGERHPANID